MSEFGTFDALIADLTLEERQELLEKLKDRSVISSELLYETREEYAHPGTMTSYNRISLFLRILLFLKSLLTGRSKAELLTDRQIKKLGKAIEKQFPGIYDYRRYLLLGMFSVQVERLKNASRFFYTALDEGFNRDKGAFFGFLGSLEMPSVHKQLQKIRGLTFDIAGGKGAEPDLHQLASRALDEAFDSISEEQRTQMYFDVRCLFCLKRLSGFPFDKLISAFTSANVSKGRTAMFGQTSGYLSALNDILFSLAVVPPLPLLESLFIFLLRGKADMNDNLDLHRELAILLERAEDSLKVIREFNRNVPLTQVLRCGNRNVELVPSGITGGEDWLPVYREYWKRQIDAALERRATEQKKKELAASFSKILNGSNLKLLENLYSVHNPDGFPLKDELSISFLSTFNTEVFFARITKIIEPIILNGVFYRVENRTDFTERYNELIKTEDDIRFLESRIAPHGEYGARYLQAKDDVERGRGKMQQIRSIVDKASKEAADLVASAQTAAEEVAATLDGILNHNLLANLTFFLNKDAQFAEEVQAAADTLRAMNTILDEIDTLGEEALSVAKG
ncbi:MAG: DUF5312 domain-containing protein [Treponema sp.]|jgi:hypothetical protein|nr:DUF5312 domain-containing protein [Treponema sp.]